MKILTGQQMKDFDTQAIQKYAIPSLILMENAGRGISQVLHDRIENLSDCRILIIAGKGNNGGDGLCVARHLMSMGVTVEVFIAGSPDQLSPETQTQAEILKRAECKIQYLMQQRALSTLKASLQRADIVIDALLGIGVKGPVRELLQPIIEQINQCDAFVVAADLPSGVDADTGHVGNIAVEADLTVTLEYPKLGLLLYPGRGYAGEIVATPIGYPATLKASFESGIEWVDDEYVRARLPQRKAYSHKGDYGRVLLIAGSRGLSGAAVMAAEAALRCGAGLLYMGYPESLSPIIERRLLEAVKFPLPETGGALSEEALEIIERLMKEPGMDVLAIGPGLSRKPSVVKLLHKLLPQVKVPMVIDADGLNALATPQGRKIVKKLQASAILTPHPGELSRLIDQEISTIESDRVGIARKTARDLGVILVLKGIPTVTARPSGEISINSTGNSGLATGGSGDVLTGLIAGLIAQGMPPEEAAPAGVYLHGLLADRLKPELGERAMLPRDLLRIMPKVLKEFG
ncbi:MAG: hypothetical protein A2Z21_05410 [Candidatus Fraserbacteria bacterium RBG_16_55_9]|uniref:Bifunctional NAD(P)H-hydrate repair enzyme n=1 Tax=Fraserbacteria sp. (strain RBG_16_55_9) TaxID=1817864 RepID=A0A1F5V2P1_FRAXR|nr:MAG: hypothetical protein A2Z21_05410 [Candidatus Fraserbacteria bacterium RBG_16_55_9]